MIQSMVKNSRSIRILSKCLLVVLAVFSIAMLMSTSVFATTCGGANTALIECNDDEGGIWHILSLVLDILSIGIAIVGVIGISVAGIQYLSASSNEEQTRKAKRRIFEIVLGLVLYAVLFVALEWLMPGGLIDSQSNLKGLGSTNTISEQEAEREAQKNKSDSGDSGGGSNSSSGSNGSNKKDASKKTNKEFRAELAKVAKSFALRKNRSKYQAAVKAVGMGKTKGDGSDSCFKAGRACSAYVATVVRTVIPSARGRHGWPAMSHKDTEYIKNHPKQWKKVNRNQVQAGDIGIKSVQGEGHIAIVVKTKNGLRIAEADYNACRNGGSGGWPHISGSTPSSRTNLTYYRFIGGAKD